MRRKQSAMAMELGARLRELRVGVLDMSLRQFADALGVSVPALDNWEQGRCSPGPNFLAHISDVTGCGIAWLLTGIGERGVDPEPPFSRVPDLFVSYHHANQNQQRWMAVFCKHYKASGKAQGRPA